MSFPNVELVSDSEEQTLEFASKLACQLITTMQSKQPSKVATVVYLMGNLGTGKTTLSRGIINALGYKGRVKSPTYTLVEPYVFSEFTVCHFDLYRIVDVEELEVMGAREYFVDNTLCLIEWPERAQGWLPSPDISVHLELCSQGRRIQVG